ncbi:MAG: tRNA lysidine(34) synthetase TilS [Candidatus Omnitrophota bacterium]|nr:tRNA lysidine(34) synthetase TilS [Candidatus Omnitrophota bacterium]
MKIQNKILEYVTEHSLIKKGDRVLLALSGGPDSVCLFHLLRVLQTRLKFSIFTGHFNHGLRPLSENDSVFCRELSAKYRIPFLAGKGSLKPGTTEDTSRKARYDFLRKTADHFSCHSIATGHQLDDQAETILLHLVRGTGLQGLSGIRPCRPVLSGSKINLIRPMLFVSRVEISGFLAENDYRFVSDATNLDPKFQRNKIRLELLPLLAEYNPNIKGTLFRMAEILNADYRHISDQADDFLKSRCLFENVGEGLRPLPKKDKKTGRYRLPLKEFSSLSFSLQREILRQALSSLMATPYRVSYEEVEYLRRFFLSGRSRKIRISNNLQAARSRESLVLSKMSS